MSRLALVLVLLAGSARADEPASIECTSTDTRVECPADTKEGVSLQRATTAAPCLLGKTWGYDDKGIWVSDGCSGAFVVGHQTPAPAAEKTTKDTTPIQTWGAVEPGKGFLVGRTEYGELSLSAYALIRYINQTPTGQTFTDHLGNVHPVDTRMDIFAHRIMVHLKGWLGLPKLRYQITIWTVNPTAQSAIFATVGYQFHRAFSIYGGLNGLPGSRTLLGSHPYWLGNDRVMADEFFRPYFTHGVWVSGEPIDGLWYTAMVGNNLSGLDITATQLTRRMAYSGTVWWMPTTDEFGPNGGFDDWEYHEHLATRFGIAATVSHEDRFQDTVSDSPDNTTIRLADAVNLFDPGSLAPGVDVQEARYRMATADAGLKYKGLFLEVAYFQRWLDQFTANGPLPVSEIVDKGFYVQAAGYPVPHQLEVYAATSWVLGDKSAGFQNSHEYLGGLNWFFAKTRDIRLNGQLIWVDRSPVSSTFGYYVGGELGMTAALALSILF